jgi:MYXO-CTERM domain-containing protein
VWTLPDGRQVFVPAGMPWPEIDGLPWEEEVQEIPSSGPAMALVDNTEKIDAALEQYNAPYKKDGEFVGAHSVGCDCRAGDDGRAAAWSLFGLLGLLGLRRRR